MEQPLRATDAKRLIRRILDEGSVVFTDHALAEMAKDGMTNMDALNVLRGGAVDEAEWEQGAWRHRVRTLRMVLVAELQSEEELVVVTGWRIQR